MNFQKSRAKVKFHGGLIIVMISFLLSCSNREEERVIIDFQSLWDTTLVLENPDKGWYHHLIDNGIWRYEIRNDSFFEAFHGMDHLYIRLAWSYLEPEEGEFDWSYIDDVVKKYVPQGYGISFRISCKERRGYPDGVGQMKDGVHYASPVWVREAGAKGVEIVNRGGVLSWSPVWDDPVFLEKLDNFHKAFAERYDDKPWVRYVDIGSIGDYGEGHTNPSTGIPPTFKEVKANIDLYLRNYKKSQLVAPDGLFFWGKDEDIADSLYNYAISKGISVRDDSPMVDYWLRKELDNWSVAYPEYFDPLYKKRPTVLELQHYSSVKTDGNWLGENGKDTIPDLGITGAQVFRNAIETMHATYIGYHGYPDEFLTDNPDLTGELLNFCGYWYFPVRAEFPSQFERESNEISMEWLNKGVAPAYQSYGIIFKIENNKNEKEFDIVLHDSGNMNWMPGTIYLENYHLSIPENIPEGKYRLSCKLRKMTKHDEQDVLLGVDNSLLDKTNYIYLGEIEI